MQNENEIPILYTYYTIKKKSSKDVGIISNGVQIFVEQWLDFSFMVANKSQSYQSVSFLKPYNLFLYLEEMSVFNTGHALLCFAVCFKCLAAKQIPPWGDSEGTELHWNA